MRTAWNLTEPLRVDRSDDRRDTVDLTGAIAIVVREGAVLASGARLIELEPARRPAHELQVFLGASHGRDLVAIVATDEDPAGASGIPGATMVPLRTFLGQLADDVASSEDEARIESAARDRELASTAVAIATWHAHHGHCSTCGEPTTPSRAGWVRSCAACERDHYPRTDPAVIVAITDPDDRLLLAHASYWSPKRYSHLAGYVEPGESLEQAVHREVAEEAGITLESLNYVGSQPWPFPASVMVGFRATVRSPELAIDHQEISDAMWVTRPELGALIADGSIVIAPAGSIARRLLEDWYGSAL